MATYPQARAVHTITEPRAGTKGTHDPAETSAPTQKALFALEFGTLVTQGSGGYDKVGPASTSVVGALPVNQLAGDYPIGKHVIDDAVAPIRRGYLHVKIDPDNKPAVGGNIRVSFASGKEGWLTSSVTSSLAIPKTAGMKIESVYDTTAEVYFDGHPEYEISGS